MSFQATTYGSVSYDSSPGGMSFGGPFGGFINGEGPGDLGPGLTIRSDVSPDSPPGTYTLQPAGAQSTNYAITYASGTLTVNPAPLTIASFNQSMTYGGTVPALTVAYSGLVNGDTSSVVQGLTCSATDASGNPVTAATPAGTYPITCSGASIPGYAITYAPGTLTISPAS
jgi:hypothetical protein